jgi:hypothetical protein
MYPKDVVDEVNEHIDRGNGAITVRRLIGLRYRGPLTIPAVATVSEYVKWRRRKTEHERSLREGSIASGTDPERDIEAMKEKLSTLDPEDHKKMLQVLIKTMLERMELMKKVQKNSCDPRFEATITSNTREIRQLIETLARLEGKLGGENFALVYTDLLLEAVIAAIAQAYESVNGRTNLQAFILELKKKMAEIDSKALWSDSVERMRQKEEKGG